MQTTSSLRGTFWKAIGILFTAHIRSFLGGNKEKLCFNLAKHWYVKQIANTFSRSCESRSICAKHEFKNLEARTPVLHINSVAYTRIAFLN